MCGRYGYTNKKKEEIKKRFRLKKIDFDLVPRYNIAPGQDVPVILNSDGDTLTLARWGLVPFWAKDEKIGNKMINARAETIFEKPSFRAPIKRKRCLILADCFYEWKKEKTTKQPYCIRMKSKETFAFAGIWDCWKDKLVTCSIITCEPNKLMKDVHHRMPVILPKDKEADWLAEVSTDDVAKLLKPFKASDMEAFPISKKVNTPSNNDPGILERV